MGLQVQIDAGGKDFEAVEEMIQAGILADIVDKGMVPNKFKKAEPGQPQPMQHKCYFVWIVEEEDSEGRNKRVFESFTVSLNEKATLRKRLKDFGLTDADVETMKKEKKALDLDKYIGTKRRLVLSKEDSETGGAPFIKMQATMPLKKGEAAGLVIPADFVRKQDQSKG